EKTESIVKNHLISSDAADFPEPFNTIPDWQGRASLVKRAEILPIECVARGYITGGGWKEYQTSGSVSGVLLPAGLQESEQLSEPIFTPSTKAETGHDEPISFEETANIVGRERAEQLRDLTLKLYKFASDYAR